MRTIQLYKKEIISLFLISILATFFWTESRYPQLNEKKNMGDRISISSALNFKEFVPYTKSDDLPKRVLISSINWCHTNWKGMTFGLLFAAFFLTLFQSLGKKISIGKNIYLQGLLGMFIGTPLGVCVNCATPIGKGMISSGQRLITSLSAMQSSPSLNVIVLGMMFTLFPVDFGIFKILFTGLFLLVILPNLVHSINREKEETPTEVFIKENISWKMAFKDIIPQLIKNLFFILKTTLPFMILSGFLGSLIVEIFPLENLSHLTFNLKNLFLVAFIGTLLPVPISFDLVVTFILMNLGLPIGLCFTLFFTLGIYSIYPMLIIWKDISFKLAIGIFLAIMLTGMVGGLALHGFNSYLFQKTENLLENPEDNHQEIFSIIVHSCKNNFPQDTENCIKRHTENEAKLGVGEKLCLNLIDQQSIENCSFPAILNHAKETQNPNICDSLKILKDKCLSAYSDSLPLYHKIQNNFCKDLKEEDKRITCLTGLKESIENSPNKDWCLYLENESLIQGCIFNQVIKLIKKGSPESLCETLSHQALKKSCYDEALNHKVIISIRKTEKDLCFQLKKQDNFLTCEKQVIEWKISTGEYGKKYCKGLKDGSLKNSCLDFFYLNKAKKDKNFTLCQKTNFPKNCENELFYLVENNLKNKEECNVFPENYKKQCLNSIYNKGVQKDLLEFKANYLKLTSFHNPEVAFQNEIFPEVTSPNLKQTLEFKGPNYEIYKIKLNKKDSSILETFSLIEGEEIGLDYPMDFSAKTRFEPFAHSLGIASGDFNNDLLPDIMVPFENNILIYQNIGGRFKKFTLSTQGPGPVILTAFVDINGDGYQDIFFSKWKGGAGFYLNNKGSFNINDFIPVPHTQDKISLAAAFGDIDGDGTLDLFLGNWAFGTFAAEEAPFKNSINQLFLNKNLNFVEKNLPGEVGGETLSVLISDINGDNRPDLMEANDFGVPDKYFINEKTGFELKPNFPPIAPVNSMSLDTGDINGDLKTDIFSVDLDFAHEIPLGHKNYCEPIKNNDVRKNCEKNLKIREIVAKRNPKQCLKFGPDAHSCLSQILVELAKDFKDEDYCNKVPDEYWVLKSICLDQFRVEKQRYAKLEKATYPQVTSNVLLLGGKTLTDASTQMEIRNSGWSWNAKIGDLDNDGWSDIYVANGYLVKDLITPKVFYHNLNGKKFVRQEKQYNLDDTFHTSSFTYVDYDNDGDLDIIATGINAPIRVFKNQTKNNSIQFIFQNQSNVFGIGAKINIYGENFSRTSEIKLGGGYQSYDSPMIHFGLGKINKISKIKIEMPFKKELLINGPFYSENRYLIKLF